MATEQQQWIESIEKLLVEAKKEDTRLKAGIRCAAPKLRGHLKEVSELCKGGRKDALDRGKAIPPKGKKATAAKKSEAPVAEPVAEPVGEPAKEPVAKKEVAEPKTTGVSRKPRRPAPASA